MTQFSSAWVTCTIFVASFYFCACADSDGVNSTRFPVLADAVTDCPADCSCVNTSLYCTVTDTITSFPVVADAAKARSIVEM